MRSGNTMPSHAPIWMQSLRISSPSSSACSSISNVSVGVQQGAAPSHCVATTES
jgi:hypothetical protein